MKMMESLTRRAMSGFVLLCACVAIGCGDDVPKGVIVKGKIVKGGQPLAVPRSDIGLGWVQVELVPDGKTEGTETTRTKEDGSFEFQGEGKGIAAGKYRLAVFHFEQGPIADGLKGAFSAVNSKINVDVPADKTGSFVDLGTIELDAPAAK